MKNLLFLSLFVMIISCNKNDDLPLKGEIINNSTQDYFIKTEYTITSDRECNILTTMKFNCNFMAKDSIVFVKDIQKAVKGTNKYTVVWGCSLFGIVKSEICSIDIL
jgi:hypothetical protein